MAKIRKGQTAGFRSNIYIIHQYQVSMMTKRRPLSGDWIESLYGSEAKENNSDQVKT